MEPYDRCSHPRCPTRSVATSELYSGVRIPLLKRSTFQRPKSETPGPSKRGNQNQVLEFSSAPKPRMCLKASGRRC